MNRGSPGAGKPHAGKYRELPLLRQRGGGGQDIPLTSALPTQTLGIHRDAQILANSATTNSGTPSIAGHENSGLLAEREFALGSLGQRHLG